MSTSAQSSPTPRKKSTSATPRRPAKGKSSKHRLSLRAWSTIGWGRRIWRVLWMTVVGVWLLSVLTVLAYRFINPPLTPLMIQRFFQQYHDNDRSVRFERDYVSIDNISPNLVDAVVYSEDGLFMYHHGFDFKQMAMSYEENKLGRRVRGGSTISQQTAKNAFLPHTRSMLRKAFEAYFTEMIELLWGKRRIMEVYLNIIEFGDGIYGCEAAAQHYFGHSAKTLTPREASQLAVCLPLPLHMNPDHRGPYYDRQTVVVMNRLRWGRVDLGMDKAKRKANAERYDSWSLWRFLRHIAFDYKKTPLVKHQ